jgi:arylsulfatase A-like enzyme
LEGRSLLPLIHGKADDWRRYAISEYDYSVRQARRALKQPIPDCRLVMVFDGRWKMTHAEGFRPMLYDLLSDPQELVDLGGDPGSTEVILRLKDAMNTWARRHHARVTISDDTIAARAGGELGRGYVIGFWDQDELTAARAEGSSGN